MNTIIPGRLPEPPPGAFNFDQVDGDRHVGWITPDTVGFRGFGNDVEAAHAAWLAHRAIARRIAQREGGRVPPIDSEPLTIHHDRDGDFVYASNRRVARLLAPDAKQRWGNSHAFELQLDAPRDEVTMRAKAHLAYRTLRRSGTRWAMWLAEVKPIEIPQEVPMRQDKDMIIENPLPMRYLMVSVAMVLLLLGALVAPAALAAVLAAIAIASLLILRLTVFHAHWPRVRLSHALSGREYSDRRR
ncbi:MAG TPA: hypothetical protein VEB19_04500 [Gemmatimonadaceae bacterium]|nr:hypothetical protein [Gemmatimonadaceae bacterium]